MWCRFFPPIAFIFFFVEIAVENIHDLKKTGWDEEKKRRVRDAMDITYMSSEEEVNSDEDSFFTVKPLPWRSEEFSGIIAELDSKFEKTQSSRSRRQKIKRVKGNNPSERPKPTLRDGHEWVFV